MNKKIKIDFNHNAVNFGDCVGLTEQRYEEIRDVVWQTMKDKDDAISQRSEVLSLIQDKLGGELTGSEMFVMGLSFGVVEYMSRENNDKTEQILKMMKDNPDKVGVKAGLNVEGFLKAMKDGKDDF